MNTPNTTLQACLKDPTWQTVDYKQCQDLMGWYPRDQWWEVTKVVEEMGGRERYEGVASCFQKAWHEIQKNHTGNKATENEMIRLQHYMPVNPDHGQLVLLDNVLSPTQVDAMNALGKCVFDTTPHVWPHYQMRSQIGKHHCTFVQGLVQTFLPGLAARLYQALQTAFWYDGDETKTFDFLGTRISFPTADTLGIRSMEYLTYEAGHKVGLHDDTDSVLTLSVALDEPNAYQGGDFHLTSSTDLFVGPAAGSTIAIFSESMHGVTPVTSGVRRVLVVEFWQDDDAPVGYPRPDVKTFVKWKQGLLPKMTPAGY